MKKIESKIKGEEEKKTLVNIKIDRRLNNIIYNEEIIYSRNERAKKSENENDLQPDTTQKISGNENHLQAETIQEICDAIYLLQSDKYFTYNQTEKFKSFAEEIL